MHRVLLITAAIVLALGWSSRAEARDQVAYPRFAELVPVDAGVPAQWQADAEALALDFARSQGWDDHCYRGTILGFDTDASMATAGDGPVGGLAWPEACNISMAESNSHRWSDFCPVYVHERLHLVRGDGWHSTEPGNPLWSGGPGVPGLYYTPCDSAPEALAETAAVPAATDPAPAPVVAAPVAAPAPAGAPDLLPPPSKLPALTKVEARRAVAARVGRAWHVETWTAQTTGRDHRIIGVSVKARRVYVRHHHRMATVRWYTVTRSINGALQLELER